MCQLESSLVCDSPLFHRILVNILICQTPIETNKSPKGTNVCAKERIGVKWGQGGCLEVCQWPSNEKSLGLLWRQ